MQQLTKITRKLKYFVLISIAAMPPVYWFLAAAYYCLDLTVQSKNLLKRHYHNIMFVGSHIAFALVVSLVISFRHVFFGTKEVNQESHKQAVKESTDDNIKSTLHSSGRGVSKSATESPPIDSSPIAKADTPRRQANTSEEDNVSKWLKSPSDATPVYQPSYRVILKNSSTAKRNIHERTPPTKETTTKKPQTLTRATKLSEKIMMFENLSSSSIAVSNTQSSSDAIVTEPYCESKKNEVEAPSVPVIIVKEESFKNDRLTKKDGNEEIAASALVSMLGTKRDGVREADAKEIEPALKADKRDHIVPKSSTYPPRSLGAQLKSLNISSSDSLSDMSSETSYVTPTVRVPVQTTQEKTPEDTLKEIDFEFTDFSRSYIVVNLGFL
jgi:hypothetical protein